MRSWVALVLVVWVTGCEARVPVVMPVADGGRVLREALGHLAAGRPDKAKVELEYLLSRDAALEDYYLHYLALARLRLRDTAAAAELWKRLYRGHPQSVWTPSAALALGRLHLEAGEYQAAESYLSLAKYGAREKSTELAARLELARLEYRRGRAGEAAAQLQEVRRLGAGTRVGRAAREELGLLRAAHPELVPRGEEVLAEARLLLAERDFVAAEKVLRRADPKHRSPQIMLLLAAAMKGRKLPAAAASVLATVVKDFPRHPLAPRALFRMATLLWNADDDMAAEAAFRELLRRFPRHAYAPEALYALARMQQAAGRWREARASYARIARRYPRADVAQEARWRVGWLLYRGGRYVEAALSFEVLARGGGAFAVPALYWEGRAEERAGHVDKAKALYARVREQAPRDYYAWRAEQRLGVAPRPRTVVVPGPLPEPSPAPAVDRYHLGRFNALRAAGLPQLARKELKAIEAEAEDAAVRQFLIGQYLSVDAYRLARRVARQLSGADRLPKELAERLLYPLGYWPVVSAEAARQEIDPLLVAAVIRQESFFDPSARSPADARGLMQLLPSTARDEAAALGWDRDPTAELQDPAVNVVLGIRHLRAQLDRWGGDVIKALAAYNGGAGAVAKWERRFGDLESDEFVESIAYRETRDYVKRVASHYRAYGSIYGGRPAAESRQR